MRYEDLEKIQKLRDQGILTEAEFEAEKKKILSVQSFDGTGGGTIQSLGMDAKLYCTLLHLSQFLGGFLGPLIMWLIGKDKDPMIDAHGKVCLNWAISSFLYAIGSALLCLVIIGIPMLIALVIANTVFIIIGAIKANEGVLWIYPGSIEFLK